MYIGVQSDNNPDIGFVIEVNEQIEKAKELIAHGFKCWICLSSTEFPTKYFKEDDYDYLENSGYAEPSVDLLDKFNIPHSDVYTCFDEDGDFVEPWNNEEIEWVY